MFTLKEEGSKVFKLKEGAKSCDALVVLAKHERESIGEIMYLFWILLFDLK